MRFAAQDEVISAFFNKYDSLTDFDKTIVPWEAVGIAAGVNLNHLYGSASLAVATYCANKSRLLIVSNHPKVTKKRIEFAMLAGGERDRTALDIMAGAQQSAKGPTFIGKAVFGGPSAAKDKDDDDDEDGATLPSMVDDIDGLFPSADLVQNKLVPIRQRLLAK